MKISNKKVLGTGFLFLSLSLLSSTNAFAVGTKFVCCSEENVSCLSGGGGSVYIARSKGRAFTQYDALKRCAFNEMFWNTHFCPTGNACPEDSGEAAIDSEE